jgi:hypothetical protein
MRVASSTCGLRRKEVFTSRVRSIGLAIGAKHAIGLAGLRELELPFDISRNSIDRWRVALAAAQTTGSNRALGIVRKSFLPSVVVSANNAISVPPLPVRSSHHENRATAQSAVVHRG